MFSYSENLSLEAFINIKGRNSDLTGEKPNRHHLNKELASPVIGHVNIVGTQVGCTEGYITSEILPKI